MTEHNRGGDAQGPEGSAHRTGFDDSVLADGQVGREQFPAMLSAWTYAQEGLQAQWRRGLAVNAHERLALMHLWNSGPMTMSELGERIPLSRAAITTLTDRLERMGYVQRTSDPSDRRRTVLVLTDRPHRVTEPLWTDYNRDLVAAAGELDDERWEWLVGLMTRLREVATRHADELRGLDDDALSERVDAAARARQGE